MRLSDFAASNRCRNILNMPCGPRRMAMLHVQDEKEVKD